MLGVRALRQVVAVALPVLFMAACEEGPSAPTLPPLHAIQGWWSGAPGSQADSAEFRREFPFTFWETLPASGRRCFSGTWVVDDARSPRRLVLTVLSDSSAAGHTYPHKEQFGIYRISADSDTLVLGLTDSLGFPAYPPSFDTTSVDWFTLYTLLRR